jgi:hypothetical protein
LWPRRFASSILAIPTKERLKMSRFSKYVEDYEEHKTEPSHQFNDRQKADRAAGQFNQEYGQKLYKLVEHVKNISFYIDWRTALTFGIVPKTPVIAVKIVNLERTCKNPLEPAPEKFKSLLRDGVKVAFLIQEFTAEPYLDEWDTARRIAEWLLEDEEDGFLEMG